MQTKTRPRTAHLLGWNGKSTVTYQSQQGTQFKPKGATALSIPQGSFKGKHHENQTHSTHSLR